MLSPIDRFHVQVLALTITLDLQRHHDAGLALRPNRSIELRQPPRALFSYSNEAITGFDARSLGRPFLSNAADDERAFLLVSRQP